MLFQKLMQVNNNVNVDYDKVVEYSTYDERLGKSHWAVPGPDDDFGFGGHCLPKDINGLISLAKQLNCGTEVLESVLRVNDNVRTNRDWEDMEGRAVI